MSDINTYRVHTDDGNTHLISAINGQDAVAQYVLHTLTNGDVVRTVRIVEYVTA